MNADFVDIAWANLVAMYPHFLVDIERRGKVIARGVCVRFHPTSRERFLGEIQLDGRTEQGVIRITESLTEETDSEGILIGDRILFETGKFEVEAITFVGKFTTGEWYVETLLRRLT